MRKLDPPAIYALEKPPPYDPWSIYGEFLMAAAKGDAPLVFDNAAEIPPRIKRTTDLTFKEINGGAICLDIFQAADDDTPRPLVIYIHGGYWKAGSQKAHGQHGIEHGLRPAHADGEFTRGRGRVGEPDIGVKYLAGASFSWDGIGAVIRGTMVVDNGSAFGDYEGVGTVITRRL